MKGEVVALRDQYIYRISFQLWAEMKIPFQLYAEMKIPLQLLISISAGWRASMNSKKFPLSKNSARVVSIKKKDEVERVHTGFRDE
jgi:hypothetical protein